jgi:hypothetical protein
MSTRRIEVRPLPIEKWHKKKGQESFMRPKTIQAFADTDSMKYRHGLSEKDKKDLKEKFKISYDLTDHFNPDVPHPFWDSKLTAIKLENNTQFFNVNNPLEFIKVSIMKVNDYVANSFKEWEDGKWPQATHYIHDEIEEAEAEASKVEHKNNAVIEATKLSKEVKLSICTIMLGKNLRESSDNLLTVSISKCIEKDVEEFLTLARKDKTSLSTEALVKEAVDRTILRREGHKIVYMDSSLGMSVEEVAEYLNKPENNDLKIHLKSKIEG